MKQNLGRLDRIFRFVLGVWVLGPWAPWFMETWPDWLVIVVGLFLLMESLFGWCGLHDALGINNRNQ